MTKLDLIVSLKETFPDISKAKLGEIVTEIFDVITETLSGGDDLTIVRFGRFSVIRRKARGGNDPRTGAKIKIPERNAVKFHAGKQLRDAVVDVKVKAVKK